MNDSRTRTGRRSAVLAVLVVAAAIGLAACSRGSSTPQVASLPGSSAAASGDSPAAAASSAGAGSTGNATQLADEWAACMRSHGDPNQADPVINSDGDIEITMINISSAMSQQAHDSTGPCGSYLIAAADALRGGKPPPAGPSLAQQLKYAECMRANGVPKYPDPNGSTETNLNGIGMSVTSPVFQSADKACSKEAGEPASGTPMAGIVQVVSCSGSPSCKPPSPGEPPPSNRPTEITIPATNG